MAPPISNAKDRPITDVTGLPSMSDALREWFRPMVFTVVTKIIVDHELIAQETQITTEGVLQPMSAELLEMKPEGQRSWEWYTIHALPQTELKTDDVVLFAGHRYRIKEKLRYADYGYVEYHCIRDYTP